MKLTLTRKWLQTTRTIGELSINGRFFCYTLEDRVRPDGVKVYGETAIPAGRYKVALTYSNRFKQTMPLLLSVPNFEGIRIHSGNTEAHTHGCILVGAKFGEGRLYDSRKVYSVLYEILAKAVATEPIEIEIVNPPIKNASSKVSPVNHGATTQANAAAVGEGMPLPPPIPITPNPAHQATPKPIAENWLVRLRKVLPATSLLSSSASSFLLQYRWPLLAIAACAFCFWLGWHLRSPKEN